MNFVRSRVINVRKAIPQINLQLCVNHRQKHCLLNVQQTNVKWTKSIYRNYYEFLYHRRYCLFIENVRSYCSLSDRSDSKETALGIRSIINNEQQKHEFQSEPIEHIRKLYPSPKNTLHNIFSFASEQLHKDELKLKPEYKQLKHGKTRLTWICTYHLKWPESKVFSCAASSKQEASYKTALQALTWLKSINKIDSQGRPLVFDHEEIKKIKHSCPELLLDKKVEKKMCEIIEKYDCNLRTCFENIRTIKEDSTEEISNENLKASQELNETIRMPLTQKFEGSDIYLRDKHVQLPILEYRDKLVRLLETNNVVIIKGEPGCGKSTQVPQYILEEWARTSASSETPCRIVVSQPRRIAAISLAARVASERQENVGNIVGYQVRFKSAISNRTRIMYCTTGILLRYLQSDGKLQNFTHVILDEAHERDVNTDLLMNLLRSAIELNPALKLIIMSATIDTGIFQNYFSNSSMLSIPGFTFPVQVNFLDEITSFVHVTPTLEMCSAEEPYVVHEDVVEVINYIRKNRGEGAILCFLPGWDDIMKVKKLLPHLNDGFVLCLHSRLQDSEQRKIFSRAPPGIRKIILATNIAETSVTVDDVVFVIDTGIHKEQRFDPNKGISSIDNHWISKASMEQRKGRAGRVQPGESFHLYTRTKFESFEKYSMPEILRTSLTKLVLDSKVYSNNMDALLFFKQLLCPPDEKTVMKAVEELKDLALLEEDTEDLTPLGRTLANFQLEPKLSKAMVNSVVFKCVTPIVDIITLFSSDSEIFATGLTDKEGIRSVKMKFSKDSDHIALMRLFEKYLDCADDEYSRLQFCNQFNLVPYKLNTMQKLKAVHFEYLFKGLARILNISDELSDNEDVVKAVLLSGVGNILQHRSWDIVKARMKKSNVLVTRNNHKATLTSDSINFKSIKNLNGNFLLYINEIRSNVRRTTLIRETSFISPLSALLFKNKPLQVEDSGEATEDSKDQVILSLEGTKIKYFCNKRQAMIIQKCKEVLNSGLDYYIYQMTEGNHYDATVNRHWNEILMLLNETFSATQSRDRKYSVKSK